MSQRWYPAASALTRCPKAPLHANLAWLSGAVDATARICDRPAREGIRQREWVHMSSEPISPELALVDPELRARARGALELPAAPRLALPSPTVAAPAETDHRYPFWARVTAALWLLVLGILIGGAAIPHAKDTPRVVPADEDAMFCTPSQQPQEPRPQPPLRPGLPPSLSGGQP